MAEQPDFNQAVDIPNITPEENKKLRENMGKIIKNSRVLILIHDGGISTICGVDFMMKAQTALKEVTNSASKTIKRQVELLARGRPKSG